ncbi:hypothetical protein ES708_20191 [subsurface metagenome]
MVKYYEASIICKDGSVVGGFIGNTEEEAWDKAADAVNTGEMFPVPVKIRSAKCFFIREQSAEPKARRLSEILGG